VTAPSPNFRGLLLVAAVFFMHEALFGGVRIDGVRPDLPLGLTVVAALMGGPAFGAIVGFISGLLVDLFVNTPFGLTALVLSLIGFGTGSVQQALGSSRRGAVPALTMVASATSVVVWAGLGTVLGLPGLMHPHLVVVMVVVSVVNAAVSPVFARGVRWAVAGPARVRVS
jgi:rod shape-determining protein MreD